jgi:hypothetical protein
MKKLITLVPLFSLFFYSIAFASAENDIQVIWSKSADGKFIIFNAYDKKDVPVIPEKISAFIIEANPGEVKKENYIYQFTIPEKENPWYSGDKIPFYGLTESEAFLKKIGLTEDEILNFRKKTLSYEGDTKAIFPKLWARIINKFISSDKPLKIGNNIVTFRQLAGPEYEMTKKEIKQIFIEFRRKKNYQPIFPHLKYGMVVIIEDNDSKIVPNFTSKNLKLGKLEEGQIKIKKIILKNIGTAIASILEFESNNFEKNYESFPKTLNLLPGKIREITIKYKAPKLITISDRNKSQKTVVKYKIQSQHSSNETIDSPYPIKLTLTAKIIPQKPVLLPKKREIKKTEDSINSEIIKFFLQSAVIICFLLIIFFTLRPFIHYKKTEFKDSNRKSINKPEDPNHSIQNKKNADSQKLNQIIDRLDEIESVSHSFVKKLVNIRNIFQDYHKIQTILNELEIIKNNDEIENVIRTWIEIENEYNNFIKMFNLYFNNNHYDFKNLKSISKKIEEIISFRNDVKKVIQDTFSTVSFSAHSDELYLLLDEIKYELGKVKGDNDKIKSEIKKKNEDLNKILKLKDKEIYTYKEVIDSITKFFKISNNCIIENAESIKSNLQHHVNYLQKNDLYIPKYIQNYEILLRYFLDNFIKIEHNIKKDSKFRKLFINVLHGEKGDTGLNRALSTIGRTQFRKPLYNDLLINHHTEFATITKKDFYDRHMKKYFIPILNDFYKIILYRNISNKNVKLYQQFYKDGVNIKLLDGVEGYINGALISNFDIHLPPLKLFIDKFNEKLHEPAQGRSVLLGLSPEYKSVCKILEKDIIYDLNFIGIKSKELGIDERHKVICKH